MADEKPVYTPAERAAIGEANTLMRGAMRRNDRGLMNQVAGMLWANRNNSMLLRNGQRDMGGQRQDAERFSGVPSDVYRIGRGSPDNPCAGR